jgi:hypothetical protein
MAALHGAAITSAMTIAITSAKSRPVYVLRLRAEPGIDPIRSLRWLLKTTLRQGGLRCISIVEDHHENENAESAAPRDC